jgi:hypothetical protein
MGLELFDLKDVFLPAFHAASPKEPFPAPTFVPQALSENSPPASGLHVLYSGDAAEADAAAIALSAKADTTHSPTILMRFIFSLSHP